VGSASSTLVIDAFMAFTSACGVPIESARKPGRIWAELCRRHGGLLALLRLLVRENLATERLFAGSLRLSCAQCTGPDSFPALTGASSFLPGCWCVDFRMFTCSQCTRPPGATASARPHFSGELPAPHTQSRPRRSPRGTPWTPLCVPITSDFSSSLE